MMNQAQTDVKPLRLAIDFDGVLHDPTNVKRGYKLGVPIDGAFEALWELKNQGALIVIHSVWASTEQRCQAIAKWCQYFKIPYDLVTNQKPDCDFYLDDRGLHFVSWDQALREIKDRLVSAD